MAELSCWHCGGSLAALSLPLSRRDECPHCRAELHVCRMCTHFAADIARRCREDDAEEVKEKQRANFCDYFKPSAAAFSGSGAAAGAEARAQLDNLFGDATGANTDTPDSPASNAGAADDLFK